MQDTQKPSNVPIAPQTPASPAGEDALPEGPASLWLYLAGLGVALSGLYAVNYGLDDQNFAMMTYALVATGFLVSYILRVRRVSLQAVKVPMLVCLGLLLLAGLSSERGFGWFMPEGIADDRSKTLQILLTWVMIFSSFRLNSDGNVLFLCVPSIALLALSSATTVDPDVQNAFFVFIICATFLVVHENYLRTQRATVLGRSVARERSLSFGQVQLAFCCIVSALLLANVLAVPIQSVGQALALPMAPNSLLRQMQRANQPHNLLPVNESDTLDLATGPVAESDTPLLRVRCLIPNLYWRGTTFDYYTGHSFENRLLSGNSTVLGAPLADSDRKDFAFSPGNFDIPDSDMQGSTLCKQEITPIGGLTSQLYGAARIEDIKVATAGMRINAAGSIISFDILSRSPYEVVSRLPDQSPDHLRAASASRQDIPEAIREAYLEKRPDETEDASLRALVSSIIGGKHDDYDRVVALRDYIASHCKYNLQAPAAPRNQDVVSYFLFTSQQGYCDSFAAALTVLCRYAGIPARIASGFLTGEATSANTYLVREKDKHAWTEVFFPRIGWVPFDATEGAEDISDHSFHKKLQGSNLWAALWSHGWLPPAAGLLLLGLLGYLIKTELLNRIRPRRRIRTGLLDRPATNVAIIEAYLGACASLARRGMARPGQTTPDEFLRLVLSRADTALLTDLQAPLERLTVLCTRFRYGREIATEDDARAAREAAALIAQALSRARRGAFALPSSA
ncbi:MAG TPA: transglutaminase domain-containing protein [Chthonomonadaceae bacterium]|nr:transglutaminase domain-containing protein [Chthonomonadaceae bacterium]